ncbi:ARPC1A [Cordylochernes scorpioides]|uniref:ARPC1A n=1 Tax=Cordylochernes scorpioides TaxID=51811 RepID=A0ABY6KS55_9ARAC|nr:ARPC1A [Cordylochernes scorpioides]
MEIHNCGIEPITCHAFNHDQSQLALSPNSHEVHIYKRTEDMKFANKEVLSQHDLRVTTLTGLPAPTVLSPAQQ